MVISNQSYSNTILFFLALAILQPLNLKNWNRKNLVQLSLQHGIFIKIRHSGKIIISTFTWRKISWNPLPMIMTLLDRLNSNIRLSNIVGIIAINSHNRVMPGSGDVQQVIKYGCRCIWKSLDYFTMTSGKKPNSKFRTAVGMSMNRKTQVKWEYYLDQIGIRFISLSVRRLGLFVRS